MDPNPSFIFSFSCSPQFYKSSIYHLYLPSCALASYHPLLTTWMSKFGRTPRGPRLYLRRVDTQTDKRASWLRQDAKQLKRERGETRLKRRRKEESPNPQRSRSQRRAWIPFPFSLVPPQTQDFKLMMLENDSIIC